VTDRIRILLLSILLLPIQFGFSQQSKIEYQEVGEIEDYSHPDIKSMYIDSNGLLWIGTNSGLNRWDGHRMINYTYLPFNSQCIPTKSVWYITGDDQNNLWIRGSNRELVRFDLETESFEKVPIIYNDKKVWIRSFSYDINGFLWILANDSEVFKYYPDAKSLYRVPIVNSNRFGYESSFPSLLKDTLGRTWLLDGWNNFGCFDPQTESFNLSAIELPEFSIRLLILDADVDSRGDFWLQGGFGELAKFNPYSGEFKWFDLNSYGKDAIIGRGFAIDHHDKIWYCTINYMECYDPVANTVSYMNLPIPWINLVYCSDPKGNILLSTESGVKLIETNKEAVQSINLKEILPLEYPYFSSALRTNQTIWIGTVHGLIRYNIKNRQYVFYRADGQPGSISSNTIKDIFQDRNGNIWIMTSNPGLLYKYDQEKDSFEYQDATYSTLIQDDLGNFCIFHPDRIDIFDPITLDTTRILFGHELPELNLQPAEYGNSQIFIRDKNGIFWYAGGKGLIRIDPVSRDWIQYEYDITNPKGLPDADISNLFCDSKGRIWISTSIGLSMINNNTFSNTAITFENYFISKVKLGPTRRITEDSNGNILVGTSIGLLFIRPDGSYDIFSSNDGLKTYHDLICLSDSTTKNEVICLSKGVLNILPKGYFVSDTCRVSTHITEFRIKGERITPGEASPLKRSILFTDQIDLRYDQNFFRIGFAATHLSHSEQNRYRYFLEGIDKDTVYAGNQSFAEYTNLAPGKYTFWVSGASKRGPWDPMGTSIKIRIDPPWYKSSLAILFYILMVLALILVYIRIRTSRLRQEKLQLEYEVDRRIKEIRQKNQQILDLDSLKTRFFNNISHEFRTLVTMIKAPAETLIEEEKISRKGSKTLNIIYRNANRLLNLVNQLLDISRLDKKNMKLTLSKVNVFDMAHPIAVSFASLAEVSGIQYRYYLPRTDALEWIDTDKLEKIITNLLSNAFKFTEEGGKVRLDMAHRNQINGMENILEISVSDTGQGIPEEEQQKIFDRFYQAEASLKKEGGGTGIGLALTRDLVELMHGTINLQSKVGKGSTFKVLMPLGKEHLEKSEYSLVITNNKANASQSDMLSEWIPGFEIIQENKEKTCLPRILVVEDNADILWLISTKMKADFSILEAVDGSAGLKLAIEHMPDLIITDLMMPRMDGYELCEKLKTDIRTSHIPIIMLTAKVNLDDKMMGLEKGADDYITKPFEIREVVARSKNLINQRKILREKFSKEINLDPRDIVITSTDEKFLKKVMDIIEQQMCDEDFDVRKLCREIGMSRSTLFRKLDALTNQSPVDFIRTLRLKRAAIMLREKYGNISEVALEVGFSNPSYFAKMFKKTFSISPSKYAQMQHA